MYPTEGGSPTLLCAGCGTAGEENRGVTPPLVSWSRDGKLLYLHSTRTRQTYAVPLQPGQVLPALPASGIAVGEAQGAIPGARAIPHQRPFMSADPSVYAYPRVVTHRNIYRILIP